ncbi:hypothetical protein OIDMADRAFT_35845 [Oidiodendron maius Zn]|uniref:Cytochrome P450 n=1 Tax=Oidiodendron maius (strain Zn) TaxID=913774 RepID=A0A0C3GSB0_OIDMZ|nr:hypothetical protein OIDMADRAFT_35845 [Oidiodendron maius Zn]
MAHIQVLDFSGGGVQSYRTAFIATAAILSISVLIRRLRSNVCAKYSAIGDKAPTTNLGNLLTESYSKYRNSIFTLHTVYQSFIILPVSFLDEIKSLPENKANFAQAFHRFYCLHTPLEVPDGSVIRVIGVDLTRNFSHIIESLQSECQFVFPREMPECPADTWTPVHLYPVLARMVALLTARVFVGLPLSRNEEWVNITTGFTINAFGGAAKLRTYNGLLHPFVARLIPEINAAYKHLADAKTLLKPIFYKKLQELGDPDFKLSNNDFMAMLIKQASKEGKSLDYQVKAQLNISMAAIHTTSAQLAQTIYDVAWRTKYQAPLREELESVLAESNEVQRMNPPSPVALHRLVTSNLKLSNGDVLPKGTCIGISNAGVTSDPKIWDQPDEFDGFRFEKLRQKPGQQTSHQRQESEALLDLSGRNFLLTINLGHGSHACPGRFFASAEIKVLLAHFLLNSDMQIAERPQNIYNGLDSAANPFAKVEFRKKKPKTARS